MAELSVIVIDGPGAGTTVRFDGVISIGRSLDNVLCIDDGSISRHHASVKYDEGQIIVSDLSSVNGVVVDGAKVTTQKLDSLQAFRLGKALLRVELVSDAYTTTSSRKNIVFKAGSAETIITSAPVKTISSAFLKEDQDVTAEDLKKTQAKLSALYAANQIITEERDLDKLLPQVMDQILALVPADNGLIMLKKDEDSDELVTAYVNSGKDGSDVVISSTIVDRAYSQMEAVLTNNAAGDSRFESTESIIGQNITSAMCVPLTYSDQVLGVIYLDSRGLLSAFDESDLQMLAAFAAPASIAIKNAAYIKDLDESYKDTLHVLANAVELRDHYTAGHIWRVTNFGIEIARELGWDDEKLKEIEMGGVMHDIGKISVDNAILGKESRLTLEEYEKVKIHPERGAWLMKGSKFLEPLIPYCLYHHEHYDGTGYPFGMVGEDIPIEGRVIAVADAFDAMTSHRSYNTPMDIDVAVSRIVKDSGSHFDPVVVEALVRCYNKKAIDHILQDYYKHEHSIVCPFCSTSIKIPEGTDITEFECVVCHRHVKICGEGPDLHGELID